MAFYLHRGCFSLTSCTHALDRIYLGDKLVMGKDFVLRQPLLAIRPDSARRPW